MSSSPSARIDDPPDVPDGAAGAGQGGEPLAFPASYAQEQMWFFYRLDPQDTSYHVPLLLRLTGELDPDALQAALNDLIARHETLRTTFTESDSGLQQIIAEHLVLPLPTFDVSALLAGRAEDPVTEHEPIRARLLEEIRRPFNLEEGPPLRARLVRLDPDEHCLLICVHHIVIDGWSTDVLLRELAQAYRARLGGAAPVWTPLEIQYGDYAEWQREQLDGQRLAEGLAYWRQRLAGELPALRLPTDRPPPQTRTCAGDQVDFTFSPELTARIKRLCRDQGATLYMVLLTGFATLLHRYSGQDDILVSSPSANRDNPQIEPLIGMFANTLPLRIDTSGNPSFTELLHRVRDVSLGAFAHQHIPLEKIVQEIAPHRDPSSNPLFRVAFALQNFNRPDLQLPGLTTTPIDIPAWSCRFDLELHLWKQRDTLRGALIYVTDLLDRHTAKRITDQLRRVFEAVTADLDSTIVINPDQPIGRIDLLTTEERHQVLETWNDTTHPIPATTLPVLFQSQAHTTPDAVAVACGDTQLTYAQLNTAANQLAHTLIARGVGPETIVALALPRSLELIISVLGVLKTGAAYLPLDPDYPATRLAVMLTDAHPALLLTTAQTRGRIPDNTPTPQLVIDDSHTVTMLEGRASTDPIDTHRTTELLPQHPAYVTYTSGSTGTPKGVVVQHHNVVALTLDSRFRSGGHQRVLVHSPQVFDASTYEMWVPLLGGGQIVLAPSGHLTPEALRQLVHQHQITALFLTTALFNLLTQEAPQTLNSCHEVWFGGEAVCVQAVDHALKTCPQPQVVHVYGPTETTAFATSWYVPPDKPAGTEVPIGQPMDNTRAYVLDGNLQPMPPGMTGELYLAGTGLARGYLHRPALTAERFIANPFDNPGTRMYRTGDLVRWNTGGNLEFIGRADDQVKIRGHRIEPGEIETLLREHPGVAQAAVITREDQPDRKRLIAYLVTAGNDYREDVLRDYLRQRLPEYMVPATFMLLDALPLTPNGKIDRRALPAPEFGSAGTGRAPRTPQEHLLTELFAQVLNLAQVGIDDDFFTLGGDSIVSLQLVSRARAAGMVLTVRNVFEHPTVAGLAGIATEVAELPCGVDDVGVGAVALTPIVHALRERGGPIEGFHQSVVVGAPEGLSLDQLIRVVQAMVDHHDVLRSRFTRSAGEDGHQEWSWEIAPAEIVDAGDVVHRVDVTGLDGDELSDVIRQQAATAESRLDPWAGAMAQVVWFDAGPDAPGRLLVVIHHLVVDGVSWRILLPDLAAAARAVMAGQRPKLPVVGTSFRRWAQHQRDWAHDPARLDEATMWMGGCDAADPLLTDRELDPLVDVVGTSKSLTVTLPPEATAPLLTRVPAVFRAGAQDVLLTALAVAVAQWRDRHGRGEGSAVLVDVEGHGREGIIPGLDLSRTVGWFTSMFPVRLDPGTDWKRLQADGPAVGTALKQVKEQLRTLPHHGMGCGALRYLNPQTGPTLASLPHPQIGFNYLGRFPTPTTTTEAPGPAEWATTAETGLLGAGADEEMPLPHGLELNAITSDHPEGPQLHTTWSWATGLWSQPDVHEIAHTWLSVVNLLVAHANQPGAGGHTPSDFPLVSLSQGEIEQLEAARPGLMDTWPLAPMQEALIAYELGVEQVPDAYMTQLVVELRGALDTGALRAAAETVLHRYPNLRTGFWYDGLDKPVQFVPDDIELPWSERDLSGASSHECAAEVTRLLTADRTRRFDLTKAPLMRFTVLRLGPDRHQLVWTVHHILVDGWSIPVLLNELMTLCQQPDERGLTSTTPYRKYLIWLGAQDRAQAEQVWRDMLAGLENPTLVTPPEPTRRPEAPQHVTVELSEEVTQDLQRRARQHGLTMNTMAQGAWALVLGQLKDRHDVVFGTTISGRPSEIAGVETMVGFFINTLPLRVRWDPAETLVQMLARVQDHQTTMTQHQNLSLADIHRLTELDELFDTVTVFENYPNSSQTAADGLRATVIGGHDAWHYPLRLIAVPGPKLVLQLWYRPDRLDHSFAGQIARRVARLTETMAADLTQPISKINSCSSEEPNLPTEPFDNPGR